MESQAKGAIELEVPGRLCLLGEHSDWAGAYRESHPELSPGYCLVAGTDQSIVARAHPLRRRVRLSAVLPCGEVRGPVEFPADLRTLDRAAREGGFFSYVAGVAAEILERYRAGGLDLRAVRSDLPIGRGLSSSAAICVLAVRAFNRLYDLGLSERDEMELAYRGERRAGSECGRMDPVCALGRSPLVLTFDGEGLEIEAVSPGTPFELLVVDLGGAKDTRRILRDLNRCFPDTSGRLAAGVRSALGPMSAELVRRAAEVLRSGTPAELGALMTEAQAVFDRLVAPACPELRAPCLHEVLDHPTVRELAFGGKGVGSQGDGCAQLVAKGPEERSELSRRLDGSLGLRSFPLTIRPAVARAGPTRPRGRIR